jgi:DNA-binding MarR family transcriptional regulator
MPVSRFAEPGDSPGFLLWHLTLRWQRQMAAALEPFGLTHVQFVLLATAYWLNRRGEHPSQLRIAAHAGMDLSMTSQALRKLEKMGLVTRHIDPKDSRARMLTVSQVGAALAKQAFEAVEDADEAFFAAWPSLADALRSGPPPGQADLGPDSG